MIIVVLASIVGVGSRMTIRGVAATSGLSCKIYTSKKPKSSRRVVLVTISVGGMDEVGDFKASQELW